MLRDVAALHPEIASLVTESISGPARTAAARSAMVGLVGASRARPHACRAAGRIRDVPGRPKTPDASGLIAICRTHLRDQIIRRNADVRNSLEALRAGNYPLRQWRAPLYRSPRIAAEAGVRAAIHFTSLQSSS